MANHSCICTAMYNADYNPNNNNYNIQLRAQNNIRRGCQISIRYLDSLQTTPQRKQACHDKWNFVCQCPRCRDPTEFQTFSSAIVCTKCSSGLLLPTYQSPDSLDCSWFCSSCKFSLDDDQVQKDVLGPLSQAKIELTKNLCNEDEEDEDDDGDDDDDDDDDDDSSHSEEDDDDVEESLVGIGTIEEWLWKAQKILHYNHVWILEMEFQLVVAYSRLIEDILCQSTSAKQILRPMRERVVQMTMHLLEVFSKIDPGSTRWRGMLMQKLVQPWMDIAKRDREMNFISVEVFKQRVFFGMLTAQEAVQCLKLYGNSV